MSFDFEEYCENHPDFNDAMNGMYKEEIIHKDPEEVDVITNHLPEPKCGMDSLVESLSDKEAEYWEMKAEVHFGI